MQNKFLSAIPKVGFPVTQDNIDLVWPWIEEPLRYATLPDLIRCSESLVASTDISPEWIIMGLHALASTYQQLARYAFGSTFDNANKQAKINAVDFLLNEFNQDNFTLDLFNDNQHGSVLKSGDLGKILSGPLEHVAHLKEAYKKEAPPSVNFKLLQELNKDRTKAKRIAKNITAAFGERCVIQRPRVNGETEPHYYAVNLNDSLGKGSFGGVYVAKEIDPDTGEIKEGVKPLAIKIFHDKSKADSPEEIKTQSEYYGNTQFVEDANGAYLFTELIPAQTLDKYFKTKEFQNLTLEQRLNLIQQIFMAVNVIHHTTASTGKSVTHNDLKPDNMMIRFDEKGNPSVYVIDFGLSHAYVEMEGDQEEVRDVPHAGALVYRAPEAGKPKLEAGYKSDIYSLAPIIAQVLGAKDPLANKWQEYDRTNNYEDLPPIPYDFTGLLSGSWAQDLSPQAKNTLDKFVKKIGDQHYVARLSTDECLKFSVEIIKLSSIDKKIKAEEGLILQGYNPSPDLETWKQERNIYQAKLDLIVNGYWSMKIGEKTIEKWETEREAPEGSEKQGKIKLTTTDQTSTVQQTVGMFVEAHPEIAPLVSYAAGKYRDTAKALQFFQTLSELFEQHPGTDYIVADLFNQYLGDEKTFERELNKLDKFVSNPIFKNIISDLYKKHSDDPAEYVKAITKLQDFVVKYPSLKQMIAGPGMTEKLPKIQELVEHGPRMVRCLANMSKEIILNNKTLSLLDYAKDKTAMLNKINELAKNISDPDKKDSKEVNLQIFQNLLKATYIASQIAERLDKKDNISPDELVHLSEKLFEQKDNLPRAVVMQMFEKIVERYIESKVADKSWHWRFSNEDKAGAGKELIDLLKGNKGAQQHQDAVHQGRLGKIADKVEKFVTEEPQSVHAPSSIEKGP